MKLRPTTPRLLLLSLILFIAISTYASERITFSIAISSEDLIFDKVISPDGRQFDIISLSGEYKLEGEPGLPLLPRRTIFLAVPDDSRLISFKPTHLSEHSLTGTFNLFPTQEPKPTNNPYESFLDIDPAFANSSYPYPDLSLVDKGTASIRGYRFFVFDFNPFKYIPSSGTVTYFSEAEFEVVYERDAVRSSLPKSKTFFEMAKNLAINPSSVERIRNRPAEGINPSYLIITSNALVEYFQPLADWKTRKGVPAEIVTVESIDANYSALDLQGKIKLCIYDYVLTYGVEFVLFGGDETIVPVYYCYCSVNGEDPPNDPSWTLPADIYYAGLEGIDITNWNEDGDEDPCEPTGDGVDLYPDVIITRAGVRSPADASAFVEKSINYEQNPPLSAFAKQMIVSGVELWEPVGDISDAEAKTDALISGFIEPYWSPTYTRLLDTSPGIDLTAALLKAYIDMGFGHMHMATHGGNTSWSVESGDSYNSNDASLQTNYSKQGMITTIACNSNAFDKDSDPCLSEAFIRNPHGGAIAYFGSSRYGWGYSGGTSEHGASFLYDDELYRRLLQDGTNTLGRLTTETKISRVPAAVDFGATRWLQFTINPQGDPELNILTEDPTYITATHDDLLDIGAVFSVTTSPPGKTVCCWMESADYYEIGTSPHIFTAPLSEGSILVTASGLNNIPYLGEIEVQNLYAPRNIDLVAPFDDAAIGRGANSLRPTLLWSVPLDPNDDNVHFRIQWNTSPEFESPLETAESRYHDSGFWGGPYPVASGTHDTLGFTFPENLIQGETYWWRVSPFDGTHYGNWTEARCFTVDTTLETIEWSQRVEEQFKKSPSYAGISFDYDGLTAVEFPTFDNQCGIPLIDPGLETMSNWDYAESHIAGSFSHEQSSVRKYQGACSYKFAVGSSGLFGGDYQQISQTFDFKHYNALYFSLYADGDNDNDHLWARVYIDSDRVFNHQIVTTSLDAPSNYIDISTYTDLHELIFQHYVHSFHLGARKDCYFDNLRLGWTIFSSPIRFDDPYRAMEWDRVKWTETGTSGDFRVTIQKVESEEWVDIDSFTNLDYSPEGHNISALGHQDSIRLVGIFTYSSGAPIVEDWSASWTYDPSHTDEIELPKKLAVSVYPNPFNAACRIVAPSKSKVKIFDINGRLVENLTNRFESGQTSTIWAPKNSIGSGVYFVSVETKYERINKRAVIIK
ncbi:T9SS type A sorting domain-containing protein [bacterium]|nr:T9SS type A sorting domain-containing protein [bacterium]